jgi:hypothetical protein
MEQAPSIIPANDIEKKNTDNEDNSDIFRKLLGEIVLEIILKRKKNGRHWVYKNK